MDIEHSGIVISTAGAKAQGGSRLKQLKASSQPPLISIVVVVFSDCAELAALLSNLTAFRGPDLELIIIDGGSKDGSVELLQKQNDEIDFWVSQPDRGIYDAMNKGIAAACGTYILHINAGDRLLRLPLDQLRMSARSHTDVVCCRVLEDEANLYTPRDNWLMRVDNTWHHQGTFYRKSAHLGYDTSYRVFGDFDHNQRLSKAKISVKLLNIVVATHKTGGASSSENSRSEVFRSIKANFGIIYLLAASLRFKIMKLRGINGKSGEAQPKVRKNVARN